MLLILVVLTLLFTTSAAEEFDDEIGDDSYDVAADAPLDLTGQYNMPGDAVVEENEEAQVFDQDQPHIPTATVYDPVPVADDIDEVPEIAERQERDDIGIPPPPPRDKPPVANVRDFGAVNDGETLCTEAFNAAVRHLVKRGGGVLKVPPGKYVVTTIYLASHITFRIEKGATLLASTVASDWKTVSYR